MIWLLTKAAAAPTTSASELIAWAGAVGGLSSAVAAGVSAWAALRTIGEMKTARLQEAEPVISIAPAEGRRFAVSIDLESGVGSITQSPSITIQNFGATALEVNAFLELHAEFEFWQRTLPLRPLEIGRLDGSAVGFQGPPGDARIVRYDPSAAGVMVRFEELAGWKYAY